MMNTANHPFSNLTLRTNTMLEIYRSSGSNALQAALDAPAGTLERLKKECSDFRGELEKISSQPDPVLGVTAHLLTDPNSEMPLSQDLAIEGKAVKLLETESKRLLGRELEPALSMQIASAPAKENIGLISALLYAEAAKQTHQMLIEMQVNPPPPGDGSCSADEHELCCAAALYQALSQLDSMKDQEETLCRTSAMMAGSISYAARVIKEQCEAEYDPAREQTTDDGPILSQNAVNIITGISIIALAVVLGVSSVELSLAVELGEAVLAEFIEEILPVIAGSISMICAALTGLKIYEALEPLTEEAQFQSEKAAAVVATLTEPAVQAISETPAVPVEVPVKVPVEQPVIILPKL